MTFKHFGYGFFMASSYATDKKPYNKMFSVSVFMNLFVRSLQIFKDPINIKIYCCLWFYCFVRQWFCFYVQSNVFLHLGFFC